MKKWKYVIFDMDGTLFDTEIISLKAWMHVKEKLGYPVTKDFCIQLIGRTPQSAQIIFDQYMPKDFDVDLVYKVHREFALAYKEEHGPLPKTDLAALFKTLRDKGYKLALCTSSRQSVIDFNLSYVGLEDAFDVMVNGSMVEKGKPFPDIYEKTAELLEADPKECIVIEDSKNGIISAHEAGMDVIMVVDLVKPTEELKNICYKIYDSLDEIVNIL